MMLKLSARGDYGLMFLQHLSKLPTRTYISLSVVAKEKQLPLKYLERLAHQLVKAGVLKSREGQGGGYALAQIPADISLATILGVLEGELEPTICADGCKACERQQACEEKTGWKKIHSSLYKTLNNFTLADLLK